MKYLICLFISSPAFAVPEIVSDPYKMIWKNFEGNVEGLVRFYLEINGDDKEPEVFVSSKALIGNGGGEFHIFSKTKNGYKYLGVMNASPDAIEVLPTKSSGVRDLKAFVHMSAFDGELSTYKFDGTKFQKVETVKIKSEEFSKKIKPAKVTTEESGPMLSWNP